MAEPKWTPGPWLLDGRWLTGAGGHATIAELFDPRGGPCAEESEANANLIAAAPELYTALAALLHEVIEDGFETSRDYNWPGSIAEAKAALAKAGGEP